MSISNFLLSEGYRTVFYRFLSSTQGYLAVILGAAGSVRTLHPPMESQRGLVHSSLLYFSRLVRNPAA